MLLSKESLCMSLGTRATCLIIGPVGALLTLVGALLTCGCPVNPIENAGTTHLPYLLSLVVLHTSLRSSLPAKNRRRPPGAGASSLSAAKTSVVSAAKTSALSAAKTSALSAAKASALKTSASSHISMLKTTTCARLRRADVVVGGIEM